MDNNANQAPSLHFTRTVKCHNRLVVKHPQFFKKLLFQDTIWGLRAEKWKRFSSNSQCWPEILDVAEDYRTILTKIHEQSRRPPNGQRNIEVLYLDLFKVPDHVIENMRLCLSLDSVSYGELDFFIAATRYFLLDDPTLADTAVSQMKIEMARHAGYFTATHPGPHRGNLMKKVEDFPSVFAEHNLGEEYPERGMDIFIRPTLLASYIQMLYKICEMVKQEGEENEFPFNAPEVLAEHINAFDSIYTIVKLLHYLKMLKGCSPLYDEELDAHSLRYVFKEIAKRMYTFCANFYRYNFIRPMYTLMTIDKRLLVHLCGVATELAERAEKPDPELYSMLLKLLRDTCLPWKEEGYVPNSDLRNDGILKTVKEQLHNDFKLSMYTDVLDAFYDEQFKRKLEHYYSLYPLKEEVKK